MISKFSGQGRGRLWLLDGPVPVWMCDSPHYDGNALHLRSGTQSIFTEQPGVVPNTCAPRNCRFTLV